MRKDQLPEAKKLRERAHELKLKADGFIKEADDMIRKAEQIEKVIREDANQAAARILREATEKD